MKAIFISYNQAYNDEIVDLLESFGQRGFTRWTDIQGRGSSTGEPRYGSHAWPGINMGIMTIVEEDKAKEIMKALNQKNLFNEALGLRAFSWQIEDTV